MFKFNKINNSGVLLRNTPYLIFVITIILAFFIYFSLKFQSDLNQMSLFGAAYVGIVLLVLIIGLVLRRWFLVFWEKKVGETAFHLQKQLVGFFAVVSLLPGVLVAIFASLFFNLGVQAWFGEPVKNALSESHAVVKAYLKENERSLGYEAQKIAAEIQAKFDQVKDNREEFDRFLTDIEEKYAIHEIIVLAKHRQAILGKSQLTFALEFSPLNAKDFKVAKTKGIETSVDKDRIRALTPLDETGEIYLWIGKIIDSKITKHIQQNQKALHLYNNLEHQRSGFEITFLIIFSIITLTLLFGAIWVGLTIANRMIHPISKLIIAAGQVSEGRLDIQIDEEHINNELDTLISSFNTMTNQLKKQQQELIISHKKAAWSDIARKIAHEIKNPLTPIQLSAERLKRRYLKQIKDDPLTFEQCIDTIIRQVCHIERLVREFSSFARMPDAILSHQDLSQIIRECLVLQENAHQNIDFHFASTDSQIIFYCDRQQIEQVLLNLLQNSVNALNENYIQNPTIRVQLSMHEYQIFIKIEDNGIGFPQVGREKLTEPYYTTREKGTGLGLAIVEKIVTDHGGTVTFSDSPHGGAMVTIILNKKG
ncbi:MAG: Adaptive-response sensory-kinase SasA [Holosporales bacterium]